MRAVLKRRAGVETEEHPKGITLLVPKRGIIPGRKKTHRVDLDPVGQLVWESADGKTTVAKIIQRVARKIEKPLDVAEEALFVFLRQMTGRGLLLLMVRRQRPRAGAVARKSRGKHDNDGK